MSSGTVTSPLSVLARVFAPVGLVLLLAGCPTIRTEHDIRITLDVNLKAQQELDDFFGDIDAASTTVSAPDSPPTTDPASDA
ncbi:MAG: hypothetical protein ACFE0O_01750 [Opitutales bacterium]